MATRTFAAGRQTLLVGENTSTIDVFDAATNNPFFLADWEAWRDGGTDTSLRDPCRFDQSQGFFDWNGGRFYGNISEATPRVGTTGFYTGSTTRFNCALWFPSGGVSGRIRNAQFGIRDNLNSGFADAIRTVQAGNITIEDCRFWLSRDDCIEADGGGNVTVRRCFFENVYVWISATNPQSSKVITVSDTLVRWREWRESGTSFQIGPVFKVDGGTSGPTWNFTNVTLCTPPDWPETGYNRTRAALNRMNCTNCTWLVYGGTLDTANGLRTAVLDAGFTLIEDGSGSAASEEWNARKAAFLGGTVEPEPDPVPLTGLTVNITVA